MERKEGYTRKKGRGSKIGKERDTPQFRTILYPTQQGKGDA
jgi:hypothetical protein